MINSNISLIHAYYQNSDANWFEPTHYLANLAVFPISEYELYSMADLNVLASYWVWNLKFQIDDIKCKWGDQILKINDSESHLKLNRQNIDEEYLESKVQELIDILNHWVFDPFLIVIHGKTKSERKANSNRRSNFIGVSKNGPNWQSMISIQKRKAYIGTYQTEREAAMAFDFHSILIHNLDAKTNFSYSKSMISSMIMNFRSNESLFIPNAHS